MNSVNSTPKMGAVSPDYIPAGDYKNETLEGRERHGLWPRVWQIVCRIEELPEVGSFVNYEIGEESIIVIRTGPEVIRAFYNVCQHRGRRLCDEERGRLKGFYCRFHGWRYDLEGKLFHVHDREDWNGSAGFDERELGLKQVRVALWGGWVWINQDASAEPLSAYLGEVADALQPFEFENCRRLWWKTIIAPVNWKVVIEAFIEGYHTFATHHSGINYRDAKHLGRPAGRHGMFWIEPRGFGEYRNEAGQWQAPASLQEFIHVNNVWLHKTLGAIVLDPALAASERLLEEFGDEQDPAVIAEKLLELQKQETEKRGAKWPRGLTLESLAKGGADWHIFPNTICLPSGDGALWYRVRPNGTDGNSCIFDIWSLGRFAPGAEPEVEQKRFIDFEAFEGEGPFLEEDFKNMVAVHKGMKSAGWSGARTNPLQEAQIANFHVTLREYWGADRQLEEADD